LRYEYGMAESYTNESVLRDHGDRFVCILFYLGRGIKGRPFDSDRIFDRLPTGAFIDKSQARAELVQHLEDERPPRIEYDGSKNTVTITDQGLQWAKRVCDKPPYLEYLNVRNGS
jgi:hypothetical protein